MSPRLSHTVFEQLEPRRFLTTVAPGLPDTSFGRLGVTLQDLQGANGTFQLTKPLPMSDGGVILAGGVTKRVIGERSTQTWFEPVTARYRADGTLDPTYGTSGVTSAFPEDTEYRITHDAIAQPDGSVIHIADAGKLNRRYAAIFRYTPSGQLDPAFGEGGMTLVENFSVLFADGQTLLLQPDGKLLFAGRLFRFPEEGISVGRLNTDGSLDETFGTGGLVLLEDTRSPVMRGLLRRPDGKLNIFAGPTDAGYTLVQLNADGSPDTSFGGGDGITSLPARLNSDNLDNFTATPDGGFLFTSWHKQDITPPISTESALEVTKVTADGGEVDTSFGRLGVARYEFDNVRFEETDLLVQPDGKILVAGTNPFGNPVTTPMLARLNADGSLDTSFASQGLFKGSMAGQRPAEVDLALAGDGAILLAGRANAPITGSDAFMLMRFHNPTAPVDEPVINIGAGTLTVRGTGGADVIRLRTRGDGRIEATVNGVAEGVVIGAVKTIHVTGGGGDDSIDAGGLAPLAGDLAHPVTIEGGDGNDVITGSPGRDRIRGEFGNDRMDGGGGDDLLSGNANHDRVHGGAGHDVLLGAGGIDVLVGDDGDDTVFAGDHDDVVYGSAGNDLLNGEGGNDKLFGEDGTDQVYGGAGHDTLVGGAGADDMAGSAGNDVLLARDGAADTVSGGVELLDRGQVDDDEAALTGIEQLLA
jgi:uncharacterized delta-60 repeat protein